eukprot:TRINITY_DN10301_c0_g2_i1.p1 TRINITY_DN10301_c0_g2~~TRINITY_DN10301_c0_g2_i1.p1  ORF type:complete len:1140 (+),score=219.02 TRINITY_DN10301_c0_g2_i1:135-3554(+)
MTDPFEAVLSAQLQALQRSLLDAHKATICQSAELGPAEGIDGRAGSLSDALTTGALVGLIGVGRQLSVSGVFTPPEIPLPEDERPLLPNGKHEGRLRMPDLSAARSAEAANGSLHSPDYSPCFSEDQVAEDNAADAPAEGVESDGCRTASITSSGPAKRHLKVPGAEQEETISKAASNGDASSWGSQRPSKSSSMSETVKLDGENCPPHVQRLQEIQQQGFLSHGSAMEEPLTPLYSTRTEDELLGIVPQRHEHRTHSKSAQAQVLATQRGSLPRFYSGSAMEMLPDYRHRGSACPAQRPHRRSLTNQQVVQQMQQLQQLQDMQGMHRFSCPAPPNGFRRGSGTNRPISQCPLEDPAGVGPQTPMRSMTAGMVSMGSSLVRPPGMMLEDNYVDGQGSMLGQRASVGTMGTAPTVLSTKDADNILTMTKTDCGERYVFKVVPAFDYDEKGSVFAKRQMNTTRDLNGCKQDESDSDEEDYEGSSRIRQSFNARTSPTPFDFVSKCMSRCMLDPASAKRLLWDLVGCLCVIHDFVMVPLQMFELEPNDGVTFLLWFVRLFWTLDFPLSFFTGFERQGGNIEMRPNKVARNYAATWMPFDIAILLYDWIDVAMSQGGESADALDVEESRNARMGKTLKSLRLLRMVRLVRLVKLVKIANTAGSLICTLQSEKFKIFMTIGRLMLMLAGIVHFIACIWYGIGAGSLDGSVDSWVVEHQVIDKTLQHKYAISYHWSLTQFMGSVDIQPHNFKERSFAIVALMVGFLISAMVVSSITSAMTRLQIVTARQSTQVTMLNQYLYDNGISTKVAMRVQKNVMYSLEQEKKNTPEDRIELLELVSEPLRVELHYEIHLPVVTQHPFFRCYNEANPAAVRRLCHGAIGSVTLSQGDVVFSTGEQPLVPQMYFVTSGRLKYIRDTHDAERLGKGDFFCEAPLWIPWIHCGTMQAKTNSTLSSLLAEDFQNIARQYRRGEFFPAKYADTLVKALNEIPSMDRENFCDLWDFGISFDQEAVCRQIFAQEDYEKGRASVKVTNKAAVSPDAPGTSRHPISEDDADSKFSSLATAEPQDQKPDTKRPSNVSGVSAVSKDIDIVAVVPSTTPSHEPQSPSQLDRLATQVTSKPSQESRSSDWKDSSPKPQPDRPDLE